MNVLPISLESRPFQALLNGLVKKNFVTGSDISSEYLLGELYAGLDEAEEGQFANEISLYEKVIIIINCLIYFFLCLLLMSVALGIRFYSKQQNKIGKFSV